MPWRKASVLTMIWRRASQALTRGWSFQRNTNSSDRRSASAVEQRMLDGRSSSVSMVERRDAAANADFIGSTSHLVGEGSSGFEKAGGAAADHRGVGGEAAGIDIVLGKTTFEGDEITLPHGVAQFAAALDGLYLAMKKLLRGVHVAIDQAGHGDGVPERAGFLCGRGFRGFSQPGDGVSGDGDGAVFDDGFRVVEADNVTACDEEIRLWVHDVCFLVAW